MRYQELTETTRNLGGFTVKVVASIPGGAEHDEVDEAFQNDEANLYYRYDPSDGRVKQRMVSNHEERAAFAQGYKDTPEQALRAHGIIRSKFDPKKFVQKQGDKWIPVFPFGKDVNEAINNYPTHRVGLTVTDPNHPMVSKRKETYQKSVRVTGPDRDAAINSAIAHHRRKGYKVHDHHYLGIVDEDGYGDYSKGATNPDGTASTQRKIDRERDRLEYERSERERKEKEQGVAEGVAESLPLNDALKVLRQYGADHFKTTSNELHFYKNGKPLSIDLIFNDDATRSVNLSQLNSATRSLKGQGVAEATGDKPFDQMMTTIKQGTNKQRTADRKEQKKQTQQQARDAFGSMFGGGNPADKLSIRKSVEEAGSPAQQAAIAINMKKRHVKPKNEAIKLDAPQKKWSNQDMQDYLTRVKTGTKTKQDRFKPIIHGSNVKAITKDDGGEEWDLGDLARQITTRPRAILGSNAKMSKSKEEGAITYDLTLPALSGIVVDEETGEFVEIVTCPGAGECQLYCYARKGGYVMFPASSMSAAQALNFLVNHPADYMKMFDSEVKKTKGQADKHGIKLLVRIHDAGDFFSKDYYNLMMDVARNNPDVKFYFYTKMGELATDSSAPPNVVSQFSPGAKSREVKTVQVSRDAGKHVKDAVTLPKDMFRDLFVTDAKGKYVKDEKGRTQVKSPQDWQQFKQKLAAQYNLDPDTIITYDEMNRIPEGPKPKWNVVVFPAGHGDLGASRLDVSKQFLMFH